MTNQNLKISTERQKNIERHLGYGRSEASVDGWKSAIRQDKERITSEAVCCLPLHCRLRVSELCHNKEPEQPQDLGARLPQVSMPYSSTEFLDCIMCGNRNPGKWVPLKEMTAYTEGLRRKEFISFLPFPQCKDTYFCSSISFSLLLFPLHVFATIAVIPQFFDMLFWFLF